MNKKTTHAHYTFAPMHECYRCYGIMALFWAFLAYLRSKIPHHAFKRYGTVMGVRYAFILDRGTFGRSWGIRLLLNGGAGYIGGRSFEFKYGAYLHSRKYHGLSTYENPEWVHTQGLDEEHGFSWCFFSKNASGSPLLRG